MPKYQTDESRTGLAKEILQVLFGLDPVVEERVLNMLKGSESAANIRTPEMRSRLGHRSIKYLRNAIDLARSEGAELHGEQGRDTMKDTDVEPGHADVKEGMSLRGYLSEISMDVDLEDPNSSIMKIKQAARMGNERTAIKNVKNSKDDLRAAQDQPNESPTKQLDIKIANLKSQLAVLQKRREDVSQRNKTT